MKRLLRILKYTGLSFLFLILALIVYLRIVTRVTPPDVDPVVIGPLIEIDGRLEIGNNWLKKNEYGFWEMYVEGEAYERGLIIGELSKELIQYQEKVFVDQIMKIIPSRIYLRFLRVVIGYFNRNIDKHIPLEYLKEIYGISKSASDEFNFIGKPYVRMLNYHAAHDIGHALLDYELVSDMDVMIGCTSFAAWGNKTAGEELIAGRNFDFYFGEDFARNVIIKYIRPSEGHPFAFVSWGGMIGVVSGMNMEGLAVTINAGRSAIPRSSSTPVTIVARDILQYASTIDEAILIAGKHQMFVSESFMITSANDNKSVIIEKSPQKTGILLPDTSYILCTNHFQSEAFANDEMNLKHQKETATSYRYERLKELVENNDSLLPDDFASILRDTKGLGNEDIGLGNEKTINQFIAHHAIIFRPEKKEFLVAAIPNILGAFIAFDLEEVFYGDAKNTSRKVIPDDPFMLTESYASLYEYRRMSELIKTAASAQQQLSEDTLAYFLQTNKNYFQTYKIIGDYYRSKGNCMRATHYYEQGLSKEINNFANKNAFLKRINDCKN